MGRVQESGREGVVHPACPVTRLLQILRPAAEDEAQNHVVDDPLDGGVVVGEDGRRFVVCAETGEGHLHGVDE